MLELVLVVKEDVVDSHVETIKTEGDRLGDRQHQRIDVKNVHYLFITCEKTLVDRL